MRLRRRAATCRCASRPSAAAASIRAIVELDAATAKQPEWMSGGTLAADVRARANDRRRARRAVADADAWRSSPASAASSISGSEQPLAAGRYSVRAELTPRNGRAADPGDDVRHRARGGRGGGNGRSRREARARAPGLAYVATADPRFRRTERLRLEVPLAGEGFTGTGRLLTREGQATPLIVVVLDAHRRGDEAAVWRRRRHAGAARRGRIRCSSCR